MFGISAPVSVKSCSGCAVLLSVLVMRRLIVLETEDCILRRAVLALRRAEMGGEAIQSEKKHKKAMVQLLIGPKYKQSPY